MNILERTAWLNGQNSILDLLNITNENTDIISYWNNFTKPPLRYYIPEQAIASLYSISCDIKLANNPRKRFDLQNALLEQYGFKPLASGTSRRAFYCSYDPTIIIKLGSDMIGRSDNLSEFILQRVLRPFCPKILDVDQTGSVMLSERVETMTEADYKKWIHEIFTFIESYYQLGYLFEDVGLYSFKNWGVRLGFGPVILDFPYLYQIDWEKMICHKTDPVTHKQCGGKIGYNYESVLSELICNKCHVRYSAQYLSKPLTGKMMESILIGRKNTMFKQNKIRTAIAKGDRILYDPNKPKVQEKPKLIPQEQKPQPMPLPFTWPQQQPKQYITAQPYNSRTLYLIENPPSPINQDEPIQPKQPQPLQQPPVTHFNPYNAIASPPVYQNQTQPIQPVQQGFTIETAKEYEYYLKDGSRFIFYPKPLKNDIIQFLKKIENNYGMKEALFISKKMEIDYVPQDQWKSTKKSEVAVKQPFPTTPSSTQPNTQQSQPVQQQLIPQYNSFMAQPSKVETVIAPPTDPVQLNIENPNYWGAVKYDISDQNMNIVTEEKHPTTGLEIMKPMTPEEIEAQDRKLRNDSSYSGYPSIPGVDTARLKEAIPKIKAIVEQRFNNFTLDNDSEKQSFILSRDITNFILEDMKRLMNDNGSGLVVIVNRTVDTHNKDCFNIRVLNHGAFVFSTVLYPVSNSTTFQQPVTPAPSQTTDNGISDEELIKFFEDTVKKFDGSRYDSLEKVRKGLIEFLYNAAVNTYRDKGLPVPRAVKEATAYVNQVVNFREKQPQQTTTIAPNTVANAL